MFDEKDVDKLSHLARIECSAEEKKSLVQNIREVLVYFQQIDEVDTEGAAPCFHILEEVANVMREDLVEETLSRDVFLANAPAHIGGMIRVPPVIKFTN